MKEFILFEISEETLFYSMLIASFVMGLIKEYEVGFIILMMLCSIRVFYELSVLITKLKQVKK